MPSQPQLEAFAKVIGMLETAIFNGSAGGSDREFYTIPHPGMFVSPNLTERANSKDMAIIADLFNRCFESTLIYHETVNTVARVYQDILEQAALPDKPLTAGEERDLLKMQEQLERLGATYQRYKERYDYIHGELLAAQERGDDASAIRKLKDKQDTAAFEWETYGKKLEFEATWAKIAYLLSVSPRLYFQKLAKRFADHTQTSGVGDYQATYLSPPIAEWSSQYAGWTLFDKTFKYSELHKFSKHSSWSGGGGGGWGLWRARGGASGSHTETYEASENIDIQLKFEYLRVRILRPWLVSDIFNYRFWTYKKVFGYREVSEGFSPGTPLGPKGLMPVLPTDVIIARNVVISAAFSDLEKKFIQDTLQASASGGWGPFSVKGSYSSTTTQEDVVGSFDGTTLRINNPQIIAFMGTLLPMSPNPDKRLPWTGDAAFPWDNDVSPSAASLVSGPTYVSEAAAQSAILAELFK